MNYSMNVFDWQLLVYLRKHWAEDRRFLSSMDDGQRESLYASWQKAVTKSLDWVE
jgi:glycerol kinase